MTKNKFVVTAQATLSIIIGLGLMIQPAINFVSHHFRHSSEVTVNPYIINASLVLMIIGMLLIYVAFYLYNRRKVAYISSIALMASALVLMILMRHKLVILLILQVIFIIWVLISRQLYTVKSDLVRVSFGLQISLLISLIGYVYGLAGFLLLGPESFHHQFSFQEAAISSFQTLFTFSDLDTATRQAELFIYSLNVISVVLFALVIGSLFKPVRFVLGTRRHDNERVLEILHDTSQCSEDYFKLWPDDKYYFFSSTRDSFLAYKISGKTAIILGDPCGNSKEFRKLIANFHEFITSNGWSVAAINATNISEALYKQQGLKELFIGNEAIITIANYIAYTSNSKHFRYINNRAERDGLTVEYWPELDDTKVRTLKQISDAWLSRGGRKEYTFFMGYFDPTYLKACSVMVLMQHSTVIGYINIVPSFTDKEASIDHLRSLPDTSPAAMHFLLAQVINLLSAQGKDFLNIGFAPLSGIEIRDGKRSSIERLLTILKKFGNRYYSFQGVEQFKGKFKPVWHPRYLYYSGNAASLARIVSDVERASRLFSERSKRYKIIGSIIAFLIIAAIIQLI